MMASTEASADELAMVEREKLLESGTTSKPFSCQLFMRESARSNTK